MTTGTERSECLRAIEMTPEDCLRCSRSEHEIAVSTNRLQRQYGEKPIQCLQRKTAWVAKPNCLSVIELSPENWRPASIPPSLPVHADCAREQGLNLLQPDSPATPSPNRGTSRITQNVPQGATLQMLTSKYFSGYPNKRLRCDNRN